MFMFLQKNNWDFQQENDIKKEEAKKKSKQIRSQNRGKDD